MLAKNEALRIRHALESLPPSLAKLVVDARSTDDTVAVARAAGARVIERDWDDFVSARTFALANVETPWALMIDADERADPVLRRALAAFEPADAVDAYRVRRMTVFCGRVVRACGWSNEPIVRLVRRGHVTLEARPAAGGSAALHERWVPARGGVETLPGTLVHESYADRASYAAKFDRYTSIEAASLQSTPRRLAFELATSALRFVYWMLLHGAYRDGWRGWYVTFWSAAYPSVVHAKALRRR